MHDCILHRKPPGSNTPKWFKFDDGDVTEAKIEDEEVSPTLILTYLPYSLVGKDARGKGNIKCMGAKVL